MMARTRADSLMASAISSLPTLADAAQWRVETPRVMVERAERATLRAYVARDNGVARSTQLHHAVAVDRQTMPHIACRCGRTLTSRVHTIVYVAPYDGARRVR